MEDLGAKRKCPGRCLWSPFEIESKSDEAWLGWTGVRWHWIEHKSPGNETVLDAPITEVVIVTRVLLSVVRLVQRLDERPEDAISAAAHAGAVLNGDSDHLSPRIIAYIEYLRMTRRLDALLIQHLVSRVYEEGFRPKCQLYFQRLRTRHLAHCSVEVRFASQSVIPRMGAARNVDLMSFRVLRNECTEFKAKHGIQEQQR